MNNLCLESYYFNAKSCNLKYEGNSAKLLFSLWLFYYCDPGPGHSTSGSTVSADLKAWVTRTSCGQVFLWVYFLIYVYFKINIFLFPNCLLKYFGLYKSYESLVLEFDFVPSQWGKLALLLIRTMVSDWNFCFAPITHAYFIPAIFISSTFGSKAHMYVWVKVLMAEKHFHHQ